MNRIDEKQNVNSWDMITWIWNVNEWLMKLKLTDMMILNSESWFMVHFCKHFPPFWFCLLSHYIVFTKVSCTSVFCMHSTGRHSVIQKEVEHIHWLNNWLKLNTVFKILFSQALEKSTLAALWRDVCCRCQ